MPALVLPLRFREDMHRLAAAAFPNEACGLLIGIPALSSTGQKIITSLAPAANISSTPHHHFEMDPRAILAAQRQADATGQAILGCWHSHPDGTSQPSQTDAELAWPEFSYVIIAVKDARAIDCRSWELDQNNQFVEEPITDQS